MCQVSDAEQVEHAEHAGPAEQAGLAGQIVVPVLAQHGVHPEQTDELQRVGRGLHLHCDQAEHQGLQRSDGLSLDLKRELT